MYSETHHCDFKDNAADYDHLTIRDMGTQKHRCPVSHYDCKKKSRTNKPYNTNEAKWSRGSDRQVPKQDSRSLFVNRAAFTDKALVSNFQTPTWRQEPLIHASHTGVALPPDTPLADYEAVFAFVGSTLSSEGTGVGDEFSSATSVATPPGVQAGAFADMPCCSSLVTRSVTLSPSFLDAPSALSASSTFVLSKSDTSPSLG